VWGGDAAGVPTPTMDPVSLRTALSAAGIDASFLEVSSATYAAHGSSGGTDPDGCALSLSHQHTQGAREGERVCV
jgi:hypothetical protein